ncbi:GH92 family glycosyl hydrolase [Polaribacter haliotis]|uniref:GH92 family glycosyl hydrolase n=1 Tax=Polaribacter haliotis TaxID=1888915 RepID=A0A7L8AHC6_9FLAO|nr:GH92 family glycosyl hydrolase [Polaribacter haliotis]QOD61199.1 GH92 family glycosyl hydrolase [Polaribacter haliotis]
MIIKINNSILKKITALFLTFLGSLCFCEFKAQANDIKTIWQIGELDNSASEFALSSPNSYKDFVSNGFGGKDSYYVVGKSIPSKDWPYLLPGPKDGFAGYGYWSGLALHQLPIYFELEKTISEGTCTLVVNILEVSAENPPLFRAFINGKAFNFQLEAGKSGNLPQISGSHPQTISFSFPAKELIKGVNEIIFQNMTGNWCVFDAIKMEGPKGLRLDKPGNTILKSVTFAKFEMRKVKKNLQPLLVDIRQQEEHASVKVIVDKKELHKNIEPGHSILEFYLPAVTKKKKSQVKIYIDGKLKFNEKLQRSPQKEITYSDYVNQFMGTSGSRWMITPGPRNPMPMVQLSPNNESTVWKAGYEYQIENISGFNHTQEWTMSGFLMMPTVGNLQTQPGPEHNPDLGYRSRINKKTETSEIGKYSVDLTDYNIHVDLSATTRAGFQRYVFPKSNASRILIDAFPNAEYSYQNKETKITRISNTKIEGFVHHITDKTGYVLTQDYKLHFVLEFNKPFESLGGWTDKAKSLGKLNHGLTYESILNNVNEINGSGNTGAFINFKTTENDTILVRSSISLISTKNAWLNLENEITKPFGWSFEKVVQNQKDIWNKYLGRIEIETDDYLQKVKFYTNFYRSLSGRVAWGDVNGQWMDMNEKVQTFKDPNQRICSGEFWNTFWNVQQLNQLIAPEFSSMQAKSLLAFYDKGGWLPKGIFGGEYTSVMVAEHGIPWIVGAWNAGIQDFDFNKAYEAMRHIQTSLPQKAHSGGGRVGNESLEAYMKYGYVPLQTDIYQSYVSNTLEYAFDDWCLAQAAKELDKTNDYKLFMQRSQNWRNIFDSKTGFMRPKNADGTWLEPFSPYHTPGFVEGNAWQFSWFVPHDVNGLVEAIGKERFISRLDSAMYQSKKVNFNALGDDFSKYPINHGNQPNMQSCYLFNYANAPWLTQKWAREIQEKYYGTGTRDAYPGDEDQGQMSAWFVMSTLGLFQMDGGASTNPQYELGSPRFEKVTIHLSDKYYGGKTFVIEAKNASRENKYIHSIMLNGKKLNSWKFPHKELIKGGKLSIEMKNVPNNLK